MILGIDVGNYATKTSNGIIFQSKVSKVGNILGGDLEIKVNGKTLYVGTGEFEAEFNKAMKQNFINLLYAAIALCSEDESNQIVVGLPIGQYKDYKDILRSRIKENIEKYSVIRAFTAVERADVCLLVIDAAEGVTEQDKKIAGYSHENGKGMIIILNKWDVIEKDNHTMNKFIKHIRDELSYLDYAPILFVSALTGQRMNTILDKVKYVANQNALRIPTGSLNEIIGEATLLNQPPSDKGKRLKIFYATQATVKPPTFILFINDKELMHFSYQRYIENRIRENYGFEGTPIRFILREKAKGDQ